MTEQELIAYIYWLKDRGQVYPSYRHPEEAESLDTPMDVAPSEIEAELIRVAFLSQDSLVDEEREMVGRIAQALGLASKDFRIITSAELPRFVSNFSIGLGELKDHIELTLEIPHPRDMLREPRLKVSAWEKLLKLKPQLS